MTRARSAESGAHSGLRTLEFRDNYFRLRVFTLNCLLFYPRLRVLGIFSHPIATIESYLERNVLGVRLLICSLEMSMVVFDNNFYSHKTSANHCI